MNYKSSHPEEALDSYSNQLRQAVNFFRIKSIICLSILRLQK